MLLDAVRTGTESFVLITGDSDQVGAIEALRREALARADSGERTRIAYDA